VSHADLCPEGIIKPEELPDKWGLLYWDGKQIRPVVAPKAFDNTGRADMRILASILRLSRCAFDHHAEDYQRNT